MPRASNSTESTEQHISEPTPIPDNTLYDVASLEYAWFSHTFVNNLVLINNLINVNCVTFVVPLLAHEPVHENMHKTYGNVACEKPNTKILS